MQTTSSAEPNPTHRSKNWPATTVFPIINGLTDVAHPCQALADIMTMQQYVESLAQCTVTFVGDGNNVARSLALGCAMVGMRFQLLGPAEYFMSGIDN